MKLADAVALAGHEVHVCRYREARTLLGGSSGTWPACGCSTWRAATATGRAGPAGAGPRRSRSTSPGPSCGTGAGSSSPPALVEGDALELPFADASFDRVMSICAIEHFDDGARALDEMARVLVPGGELVMSADALTLAGRWPGLYRAHCERYHVQRTYSHAELTDLLAARGLEVTAYQYQFRSRWAQRMYLGLSAYGGKFGFNAAAQAMPLVAAADRGTRGDGGAIVLVRARRQGGAGGQPGGKC